MRMGQTKWLTYAEKAFGEYVNCSWHRGSKPWPLKVFFDDDVNVGGFPSQTSSHGGQTSDPIKIKEMF